MSWSVQESVMTQTSPALPQRSSHLSVFRQTFAQNRESQGRADPDGANGVPQQVCLAADGQQPAQPGHEGPQQPGDERVEGAHRHAVEHVQSGAREGDR